MTKRKNLDSRFGDFANNVTRKFRSRSQYEFSTPQLGEYQFAKNGLYQKICSIPAQDAIKNGYEICSNNEDIVNDEETSKINKVLYDFDITKEDIMEFMILAASNIDVKKGVDDDVTKAWISKLDQVYQRAEISMGGHPDFAQIKSIYDRKKKELKNKKIKGFLIGAGCVAGWFFLIGLLWNPSATIAISIGVLALVIIGSILFKKR